LSGSWDRSITSISRGSAAREASRKEIIGVGLEIIKFRQSDWSIVALVAQFMVLRALGPRNIGRIVASSNWLGVFLVIYSGKHVVGVDHGSHTVLNLERCHAILGS